MEKLDVIADLMKSAPMTARKLSELIDTEYSYVCKVLKGEKPLTDEMLVKIYAALEVSTTFTPMVVPLKGEIVLKSDKSGTSQMWDKNGKWLGDYWKNAKGEIRPLFSRNPDLSKEQNDIDAAAFLEKWYYYGMRQRSKRSTQDTP